MIFDGLSQAIGWQISNTGEKDTAARFRTPDDMIITEIKDNGEITVTCPEVVRV
jgi:hypothetical protein